MDNHVFNSLSSEQPLFEHANSLHVNFAEHHHEQNLVMLRMENHVSNPTSSGYANSLHMNFEESHREQSLIMFRTENHVSNLTNSERPFATIEEEMEFVGSFLVDNSQEQVHQDGPTPPPTGSSSEPINENSSSNGESSMRKSRRPTLEIPNGSVILALPAKGNDIVRSNKVKNTEVPRSFELSSIEIGSWKRKASDTVSLSANINFGWHNLLWQIEERGQRTQRIQFKWGDISEMKVYKGEETGIDIKLKGCPKFLCENGTNPVTRRTAWATTGDFTNREAERHWHIVKCAPDSIKHDVRKLLNADPRLNRLCKKESKRSRIYLPVENMDGPGWRREGEVINHDMKASSSQDPSNSVEPHIQNSGEGENNSSKEKRCEDHHIPIC